MKLMKQGNSPPPICKDVALLTYNGRINWKFWKFGYFVSPQSLQFWSRQLSLLRFFIWFVEYYYLPRGFPPKLGYPVYKDCLETPSSIYTHYTIYRSSQVQLVMLSVSRRVKRACKCLCTIISECDFMVLVRVVTSDPSQTSNGKYQKNLVSILSILLPQSIDTINNSDTYFFFLLHIKQVLSEIFSHCRYASVLGQNQGCVITIVYTIYVFKVNFTKVL